MSGHANRAVDLVVLETALGASATADLVVWLDLPIRIWLPRLTDVPGDASAIASSSGTGTPSHSPQRSKSRTRRRCGCVRSQGYTVPRGIRHKTSAPQRTVILMVEPRGGRADGWLTPKPTAGARFRATRSTYFRAVEHALSSCHRSRQTPSPSTLSFLRPSVPSRRRLFPKPGLRAESSGEERTLENDSGGHRAATPDG